MPRHPIRDTFPAGFDQDRLWIIHTPEFSAGVTEYNNEVTGSDSRLKDLDKEFYYGGNMYYILNTLVPRNNWRVESIEDRI